MGKSVGRRMQIIDAAHESEEKNDHLKGETPAAAAESRIEGGGGRVMIIIHFQILLPSSS